MKRFRAFLLLALPVHACLLLDCAPGQVLHRRYSAAELQGRTLLIHPVPDSAIQVVNPDDFMSAFPEAGDPAPRLAALLDTLAAAYFTRAFPRLAVAAPGDPGLPPPADSNSIRVADNLGMDTFSIRIPGPQAKAGIGSQPRFVLVMDKVIFRRRVRAYQYTSATAPLPADSGDGTGATLPVGLHTYARRSLEMSLAYAIYDYEARQAVAYGFASGESRFPVSASRKDWQGAALDAFGRIARSSPFVE